MYLHTLSALQVQKTPNTLKLLLLTMCAIRESKDICMNIFCININAFYLQITELKGTTLWSAKEDDQFVHPPDNLAKNLLVNDKQKAHLLNQFLRSYFFRNMAYVSNKYPLSSTIWKIKFLTKFPRYPE